MWSSSISINIPNHPESTQAGYQNMVFSLASLSSWVNGSGSQRISCRHSFRKGPTGCEWIQPAQLLGGSNMYDYMTYYAFQCVQLYTYMNTYEYSISSHDISTKKMRLYIKKNICIWSIRSRGAVILRLTWSWRELCHDLSICFLRSYGSHWSTKETTCAKSRICKSWRLAMPAPIFPGADLLASKALAVTSIKSLFQYTTW